MASAARKLDVGDVFAPRDLVTIHGATLGIPDPRRRVHLQLRRYAGCPICSLHLRTIAGRHDEIVAAGIVEVAVFHSSAETLLPHQGGWPFAVIGDPGRHLYAELGAERSFRAVFDPRAWGAARRGAKVRPAPEAPSGSGDGVLGLPADFLIAPDGRVLASKYGEHADDQWSVDELLQILAEVV